MRAGHVLLALQDQAFAVAAVAGSVERQWEAEIAIVVKLASAVTP